MKYLLLFISVVATSFVPCLHASGESYTIEDGKLASVKNDIYMAVSSEESYKEFNKLGCSLEAEKINLSPERTLDGYLVTTSNACGWGSALGPIWIVAEIDGRLRSVLSVGGYSISILSRVNKGMHDISVNMGTGAVNSSRKYTFDGSMYN
jgi:hypothetical protein